MKLFRFLHDGRVSESTDVPTGALLLPPVTPTKIVCIGRNYADHAKELGNEEPAEPLLFFKPPSALLAPNGSFVAPPVSQRVDFEVKLAIVIGREAKNVPASAWRDYVRRFTCANDVTARDLQKKDVQFTRGKSFDTFCPLGPWIVTNLDPENITVTTRLNGEVKQHGHTAEMAFSVAFLIHYISAIMTLYPGDLILTGTPAGVSRLKHGDTVEVEVGGVGILRNQVYDPRQINS